MKATQLASFPNCGPIINNKIAWERNRNMTKEREQEEKKARSVSVGWFTFPGCLGEWKSLKTQSE
jgi:hypothetical protein